MRQKGWMLGFLLFFIFAISLFSPRSAQAVPAFARQTGLACTSCHFQHYPALNAFGRTFKAGGFTMVGGQSMIEGNMLALPSVLNASMVLKVRYQKTNGDNDSSGTNKGELQFPDEAALFLGGRVGEHIGFILEGSLIPGETDITLPASAGGEDITVPETNLFTSFKMPFVYDVGSTKVSVIPFNTDALGASFGFELLNSGAVRNIRTLEHRKEISAQQYIGTSTAAEGIAFVAANNMGFINYSLWAPSHTAKDVGPMSHYLRITATPTYAGWDLGGGIQWWGGTTGIGSDTCADTTLSTCQTHAWAIDAQAQGAVMEMPLGVYLAYGSAEKSDAGEPANLFNSGTNDDKTALTIIAELGVLPNKATVALGYRSADTGAASKSEDNAFTFGATYQMAQNVQLQLDHSSYSGDKYDPKPANGDQLTTLMLFTAF